MLMQRSPNPAAWNYRLAIEFDHVRAELRSPDRTDRLATTVSHWALPTDRYVPRVFLGHTLAELLDTPFDKLSATPSVGPRKLDVLIGVLRRAAEVVPKETSNGNGH